MDADAPSERWKFLDPETWSDGALKKAYMRAAPMRRGIIYVYECFYYTQSVRVI